MDEASKLRYLKEVDYFSSKLESNPSSKIFLPLALAYLRLGKFDEVITVCQSGLDHNPDYIAAKTVMAEAFLGKGLKEDAKGLLIEVTTLNQSNYKANKLLGDIYRSEENFEKALYYYRTALAGAPEDNTLRMLIEELAEVADVKPADKKQEEQEETEEVKQEEDTEKKDEELLNEAETLSEELQETDLLELDFDEIDSKINGFIDNNQHEEAKSYVKNVLADYPDILSEKISFIENSVNKTIEVEIPDAEDDFASLNAFREETLSEDADDPLNKLFETDSNSSDVFEPESDFTDHIDFNDKTTDDTFADNIIRDEDLMSGTNSEETDTVESDSKKDILDDIVFNDNETDDEITDNTLADNIITDVELMSGINSEETATTELKPEEDISENFDEMSNAEISDKETFRDTEKDLIDSPNDNLEETKESNENLPDLSIETDDLSGQSVEKTAGDTMLDIDDKVNQKLADLGLQEEEKNENEAVINELEGWLQNINKLKSKKNV